MLEAHAREVAVEMRANTMLLETFESRMFSFCLGREPKSDGYVVWSDNAPLVKPGYFQRLRVTGNHTWSMTLDEPKFKYDPAAMDRGFDRGNKFEGLALGCENGCGALLDTGTSLMAIPGSVINAIIALTLEPGFKRCNLSEMPSIKIRLGGQDVVVPPDAYIAEVANSVEVPAFLQSIVRLRRLHELGSERDG